jgi:ring-1,2-phenylacetyl-CoA epoxidase subunit PaaD
MVKTLSEDAIRTALAAVMDPEIPTCSITDLGILHDVRITKDHVEIDLLPTFAGCPALDVIREDVETAIRKLTNDVDLHVHFVNDPPWTTDRISVGGREALDAFGIAPPVLLRIARKETMTCPYCGSQETALESAFGPTPCRTVNYCSSCRNPFEGFKTKQASPPRDAAAS